jgi:hypothetical protein
MLIQDLSKPGNLRGYAFEYIVKVMLRRAHKNNFIFQMCFFDSIDEILSKYRLHAGEFVEAIEFMRKEWGRSDLIEFVLDSKETRIIKDIIFYDIKTKNNWIKRSYFEVCVSNDKFAKKMYDFGILSCIVLVTILPNWNFSLSIHQYFSVKKRIYTNFKKT